MPGSWLSCQLKKKKHFKQSKWITLAWHLLYSVIDAVSNLNMLCIINACFNHDPKVLECLSPTVLIIIFCFLWLQKSNTSVCTYRHSAKQYLEECISLLFPSIFAKSVRSTWMFWMHVLFVCFFTGDLFLEKLRLIIQHAVNKAWDTQVYGQAIRKRLIK